MNLPLLLAVSTTALAGEPPRGYFGVPWGAPCEVGVPLMYGCDPGGQVEGGVVYECRQVIDGVQVKATLICEHGRFVEASIMQRLKREDAEKVRSVLKALWGPPERTLPNDWSWNWPDPFFACWRYYGGYMYVTLQYKR